MTNLDRIAIAAAICTARVAAFTTIDAMFKAHNLALDRFAINMIQYLSADDDFDLASWMRASGISGSLCQHGKSQKNCAECAPIGEWEGPQMCVQHLFTDSDSQGAKCEKCGQVREPMTYDRDEV